MFAKLSKKISSLYDLFESYTTEATAEPLFICLAQPQIAANEQAVIHIKQPMNKQ